MKKIILTASFLLLGACANANETLIETNNYDTTIANLQNHFSLENDYETTSDDTYDAYYKKYELSREISIFLDKDNDIGVIEFIGITIETTENILDDLSISENEDLNLLLNSLEEYEKKYSRKFNFYEQDDLSYYVTNIGDNVSKKMNKLGPINLFIILDKNLNNNFTKYLTE